MSSRCPDAQLGGRIRNRMCRYVTGWRCACGNLNKKARENCYFPTCNFSTMAAGKLESDFSTLCQTYLDNTFPPEAKRKRSAVIRQQLADKIVRYLKDSGEDKNFRHFVKKSGFQLLDLRSVGVRDVLVVKVKQDKQVSHLFRVTRRAVYKSACCLCICACANTEVDLSQHTLYLYSIERERQDNDGRIPQGCSSRRIS